MRYSEQSRNLAASVVLEAAVAEAVAILRPRSPGPNVDGSPRRDVVAHAENTLLAAAQTAQTLIEARHE